ncbi:MAG: O-antigen ligase family protein [Chitinophagales bacterium]
MLSQYQKAIGYFYFACMFLAVVLMPWHKTLTSGPFFFMGCAWLIARNPLFIVKDWWNNKRIWLFAAIYLVAVIAWYFSDDRLAAAVDMRVKSYLFLLPIVLGSSLKPNRKQVFYVLAGFVVSCIAFALFALGKAVYDLALTGKNHFYYKDLVAFTYMHPAYIGMFIAFAVILTGMLLLATWDKISTKRRLFFLLVMAFLSIFIFLLTAKMAIFSLAIFLILGIWIWGYRHGGFKRAALMTLLFLVFGITLVFAFPYTRLRFQILFNYHSTSYTNSVESRTEIWKAGSMLMDAHHYRGIGSGDAADSLIVYYQKIGFEKGVEERYNTHNQFMQVQVESGWGGTLLFAVLFAACLYLAWRERNWPWMALILLFLLNSSTESMLKTQSGVVFFAFFNAFLGMFYRREEIGVKG